MNDKLDSGGIQNSGLISPVINVFRDSANKHKSKSPEKEKKKRKPSDEDRVELSHTEDEVPRSSRRPPQKKRKKSDVDGTTGGHIDIRV